MRSHKLESSRQVYVKDVTIPFLTDVFAKVYPRYGINITVSTDENIPFGSRFDKDERSKINGDFLNMASQNTTMAIQGVLDKMTDQEILNTFVLSGLYYNHYLNLFLSPLAFSISEFHHKLLGLTKSGSDQPFYKKGSLPKMTYISFTGIYSEFELDLLSEFSEHIQIIMIYDENTGGPKILGDRLDEDDLDFRKEKRYYRAISDKILLLPLKAGKGKPLQSNEIWSIFETFVFKAINQFKPDYIAFNHSFIFHRESNAPFYLDEATLGRIVYNLAILADYRMIISPFKIPDLCLAETSIAEDKRKKRMEEGDKIINFFKEKTPLKDDIERVNKLEKRLNYIFEHYGVSYDRSYFKNCYIICLEALSGLKRYKTGNLAEKSEMNINPILSQNIYEISNHYKSHSYYNTLYSPSFKSTLKFQNHMFKQIFQNNFRSNTLLPKPTTVDSSYIIGALKLTNYRKKIPYYDEYKISCLTLERIPEKGKTGSIMDLVLDEESQVEVDYKVADKIRFFLMNAIRVNAEGMDRDNFLIEFDKANIKTTVHRMKKPGSSNIDGLRASGLCAHGDRFYVVYGMATSLPDLRQVDVNTVWYYDIANDSWGELTPKGGKAGIPRHNVNVCIVERKSKTYLYVMGGEVVTTNDTMNSYYDIYNLIEVLEISPKNEYIYSKIDKSKIGGPNHFSYIPFIHSYSMYNDEDGTLTIMGGRAVQGSVNDWSFFVFELNVDKQELKEVKHFINSIENYDKKDAKSEEGQNYRKFHRLCAVADKDRNMFYDKQNKTVYFIYRNKFSYYLTTYEIGSEKLYTMYYENLNIEFLKTKLDEARSSDAKRTDKKQMTLQQSIYIGYIFEDPRARNVLRVIMDAIKNLKLDKNVVNSDELLDTFKKIVTEEEKKPKAEEYCNRLRFFIEGLEKYPEIKDIFIAVDDRFNQIRNLLKEINIHNPGMLPITDIIEVMKTDGWEIELGNESDREVIKNTIQGASSTINSLQSNLSLDALNSFSRSINQSSYVALKQQHQSSIGGYKNPSTDQKKVSSISSTLSIRGSSLSTQAGSKLPADVPSKPENEEKKTAPNQGKDEGEIKAEVPTKQEEIKEEKKVEPKVEKKKEKNEEPSAKPKARAVSKSREKEKAEEEEKKKLKLEKEKEKEKEKKKKQKQKQKEQEIEEIAVKKPKKKVVAGTPVGEEQALEESKSDEIMKKNFKEFKQCLKSDALKDSRLFFNPSGTEMTLDFEDRKLRINLCVLLDDNKLEKLCFREVPYSCAVYNSCFLMYFDKYFEDTNSRAYQIYKNYFLFCNLEEALDAGLSALEESDDSDEVFIDVRLKPLFKVKSYTDISRRGVALTPKSIFLFGGSSFSEDDDENPRVLYNRAFKYDLSKDVSSSKFETQLDIDLEEKGCGVISVVDKDFVYVCTREKPKYLHVFTHEGSRKKVITLPQFVKDENKIYRVQMNLIQQNKKPKLLFNIYEPLTDSMREYPEYTYKLYDLQKQTWKDVDLTTNSDIPHLKLYTERESTALNFTEKPLDRIYKRVHFEGQLHIAELIVVDKGKD